LWFLSVNRNKHGITLDISDPKGRGLLLQLIRGADVMLVNLPARAQRKLGIDAATLAPIAPGLIHASITGFGLAGERADLPCYDLIAEGYSGVMQMTGEPESPPQKVGTPAADLLAGEDAALAITAALLRKQRTGKGAAIDISMVESMTRFMAPRLVPYLGSGERLQRSGGRDSVIAIYQAFDTADEPLTLGLGNDAIWRRFWKAVGNEAAGENPAHSSNKLRRIDRPALVARIADLLKSRRRDEWLEIFARARVPAGPIYRLDEIAGDNGLRDRGFLYGVDYNSTRLPQVGLGIGVDGNSERCLRLPLKLGADNTKIFCDRLGLSHEDMTELERSGIV
jgi:crotonobetainyl-CoA:carnitine CoA-transferase CaiB-like acyl-CoA transferase